MESRSDADGQPYWRYPSFKEQIRTEGVAYSARWRIHYVSSSGELTVRTVQISHYLTKDGTVHILGFCSLRGAERAFRLANIQRAYDLVSCLRIEDPTGHILSEQRRARRAALEQSWQALERTVRDLIDRNKHRAPSARQTPRKRAPSAIGSNRRR